MPRKTDVALYYIFAFLSRVLVFPIKTFIKKPYSIDKKGVFRYTEATLHKERTIAMMEGGCVEIPFATEKPRDDPAVKMRFETFRELKGLIGRAGIRVSVNEVNPAERESLERELPDTEFTVQIALTKPSERYPDDHPALKLIFVHRETFETIASISVSCEEGAWILIVTCSEDNLSRMPMMNELPLKEFDGRDTYRENISREDALAFCRLCIDHYLSLPPP